MSYKVSAANLSEISLNETDLVKSVLQNVACILATRQGTVPLYRRFGLDQSFLDKPASVARVLLIRTVKEAVEEHEPRAEIVAVSFDETALSQGILIPTVEVNILES